VLWEGFLKPRREAKRLARGIAAEVSLITRHLDTIYKACIKRETYVPDRFNFPPTVFAANAGRIGELDVADDLILFYAQLTAIGINVAGWNDLIDRVRADPSVKPTDRDTKEDAERSRTLRLGLEAAIATGITVLKKLRPEEHARSQRAA
jgi:hypothetical protein